MMDVKGGKDVTLTKGHTFYEGPADIYTAARNASSTKPAKFIVTMVKWKDVPFFIPVKQTTSVSRPGPHWRERPRLYRQGISTNAYLNSTRTKEGVR
ncbi:hypothetical protein J2X90_002368 [Variovorax paradoxus]|uniref:hypothetical protein n=1 Tax=Variovorax paradoxus TaxID=34073 RepID=UPI0027868FFF|nr:hypothetical protein [Variovorax paradoxus]